MKLAMYESHPVIPACVWLLVTVGGLGLLQSHRS